MTEVLSSQVKEAAVAQIPLGRFGETQDIANTVAFLASEKSRLYYRTGYLCRWRYGDVKKGETMRRVVVTGMGAVTPIGIGADAFWENVKKKTLGFGEITQV